MRKLVPTIVAVAVLAAIGVYVGFYETSPKPPEEETVYELKQEDISKFLLEDLETGLAMSCAKQDGLWWITAPQRLEAQADTVDIVLRHLARPEVERKLGPQQDLTPFGLEKPSCRATVTTADGKSRVLLIGAKNPTDTAYFAKEADGTELFTIAKYSADNLRKNVADLRNKTLMSFEPADVVRLVVKRPKVEALEFSRAGDEDWKIVKPVSAAADRYAVESLLNDMKNLKGSDIVEEPHAYSKYKLDQARAEIVVYTRTGKPQNLVLSLPDENKKSEAYASSTRVPYVVKLGGSFVLDNAAKDLAEWRERLLFSVNREDAREVRIDYGGFEIACAKGARDAWSVKSPPGVKVEDELNDMLFEVIYARAEEFTDDAPKDLSRYGLAAPRARVTVSGVREDSPFSVVFDLGARTADHAYLKLADGPAVFAVRKELIERVERFGEKVKAEAKPASSGSAKQQ